MDQEGESSQHFEMPSNFRRKMTLEQAKIAALENQQAAMQNQQAVMQNQQAVMQRLLEGITEKRNILQVNDRRSPVVTNEAEFDTSGGVSSSSDEDSYHHKRRYKDELRDLNLELPEYDGSLDPEVFRQWLTRCNRIFEQKENCLLFILAHL